MSNNSLILQHYDYQQRDTYLTNSFNDLYTAYLLLNVNKKQAIILLQQSLEKIMKEVFHYLISNFSINELTQYLCGMTLSNNKMKSLSNSHHLEKYMEFFTKFQIMDGFNETMLNYSYLNDLTNCYFAFRYPDTIYSSSIAYSPDLLVLLFERCLTLYQYIYINYYYLTDDKLVRDYLNVYNPTINTLHLKDKDNGEIIKFQNYKDIIKPSISEEATKYLNSIRQALNYVNLNVYEIERFNNVFLLDPVDVRNTIDIAKFRVKTEKEK